MGKIKQVALIIGAGLFASLNLLHATLVHSTAGGDLSMLITAVEQTEPTPAEEVPAIGTFYSTQSPAGPPLPGNFNQLPAWSLGGNMWLLDDADTTSSTALRSMGQMTSMDVPSPGDGGDYGGGGDYTNSYVAYTFDTNSLWLEITNVSNGWSYLNLHNATNQVYAIESTTDLPAGFQVETELWPVGDQTNVLPFAIQNFDRQDLFFRAQDWTGVDSDGDGIPDWWIWQNFGDLSGNATNLDLDGNTLGYDYTNNLVPHTFTFSSIEVSNNYVSSSSPPVQLDVTGYPYYVATLVDDTNFSDAVWNLYATSNLTVNLGLTEGWHDVWIGLRGHADAATAAVWQSQQLNLDYTPPQLTVTSPTATTVSVPMIQVQGFANEPLAHITYDISNAAGLFTNQTGYVTDEFWDASLSAFTTNFFQCYDVALTNGLNQISVHVFDLAGNETTTNVSLTVDYSGDTTAPALTMLWPTDGTPISGASFTLQAQMDDYTATVNAAIVDTNGVTNIVQGLVERSGLVSASLPLSFGTNTLTITATDAAGNTTVTNLTVVRNDADFTMNPLTDDQLNQPFVNVSGTVSDVSYSVTVNGVAATVSGDPIWEADNVPVNPVGTARFNIVVRDSSDNLITTHAYTQPQLAKVGLMSCSYAHINYNGLVHWSYLSGGDVTWETTYDSGGNSFLPGDVGADEVDEWIPSWGDYIGSYFSQHWDCHSKVMIEPAGNAPTGGLKTYIVKAQVWEQDFDDASVTPRLLNPPEVQIRGETLVPVTNSDGSVWGETVVTALAGANVEITPKAAGIPNISFGVGFDIFQTGDMQLVKTKEDWQADVRTEINQDSHYSAMYDGYQASDGFDSYNRKNIQAVYAFYQKVYLEQPTEYYWCGLAKLAGAPVYAALSDAQHAAPLLYNFQDTLVQMNINILNDLAWQFEAYRNGGLNALEEIFAVDQQALDSDDITAWRKIDQGIQLTQQGYPSGPILIQQGNQRLLQREQQQVLADGYQGLSTMDAGVIANYMSLLAECPIWDPSTNEPYAGRNFEAIVPGGNLTTYDDRWTWITYPTIGIWDTWTFLTISERSSQVSVDLRTRASTYANLSLY